MKLRNDDDIVSSAGNDVFLGPPGWKNWPFRIRYRSWGVGFGMFVLALLIERQAGLPVSFQSLAFALMGACFATTGIMRLVTPDRPLKAIVRAFWTEVTTPREPGRFHVQMAPARVPAHKFYRPRRAHAER